MQSEEIKCSSCSSNKDWTLVGRDETIFMCANDGCGRIPGPTTQSHLLLQYKECKHKWIYSEPWSDRHRHCEVCKFNNQDPYNLLGDVLTPNEDNSDNDDVSDNKEE